MNIIQQEDFSEVIRFKKSISKQSCEVKSIIVCNHASELENLNIFSLFLYPPQ